MKDLRQLDDYEKKRFAICHELAREFLAKKERRKCYEVFGTDIYTEGERELSIIIPLTDEQVEEIKTQMIEAANKIFPDEPINTWEEFTANEEDLRDASLYEELNNSTGAWNDYVYCHSEHAEMIPYSIDFTHIQYLYQFSCFVYEPEKKEIGGPYKYLQVLTDEDYSLLLALQLSVREEFSYNSLFKIDPEFAQRLNRNIDFSFFDIDCIGNQTKPFVIIFDELVEDAKELEEERNKRLTAAI